MCGWIFFQEYHKPAAGKNVAQLAAAHQDLAYMEWEALARTGLATKINRSRRLRLQRNGGLPRVSASHLLPSLRVLSALDLPLSHMHTLSLYF